MSDEYKIRYTRDLEIARKAYERDRKIQLEKEKAWRKEHVERQIACLTKLIPKMKGDRKIEMECKLDKFKKELTTLS